MTDPLGPQPDSVTYVVSRWGAATETFVRREALAVQSCGVPVSVCSLRRPERVTGGAAAVPVTFLPFWAVLIGLMRMIMRRPRACLAVLSTVVVRSSRRNVLPQLAAAAAGLAWAGRGEVGHGTHVHAHFGWVAATASWAAATAADVPYSVVLHAFEIHDARYRDGFTEVPLRGAACVFTISDRDRAVVERRWGLCAQVLRMGVPRSWVVPETGARDDRLVVSVGSLLEKKGHAVLLEALARAVTPWRAVVVGAGPLASSLIARAEELGLEERVEFVGARPEAEVRALLRRAAVAALASVETRDGDRDGVPVALMEAMAVGAAVVTTTVGAIPELVEGAGILVAPGDAQALADALDDLADPEVRADWTVAGRRRVLDGWIAEENARRVAAFAAHRAAPSDAA